MAWLNTVLSSFFTSSCCFSLLRQGHSRSCSAARSMAVCSSSPPPLPSAAPTSWWSLESDGTIILYLLSFVGQEVGQLALCSGHCPHSRLGGFGFQRDILRLYTSSFNFWTLKKKRGQSSLFCKKVFFCLTEACSPVIQHRWCCGWKPVHYKIQCKSSTACREQSKKNGKLKSIL